MRYVLSHLVSTIWGINLGALLVHLGLKHLDKVESIFAWLLGEHFRLWMISQGTLFEAQVFVSFVVIISGLLTLILNIFQK